MSEDTTRKPRAGEQDGREYNFTTQEDFLALVNEGGFIEHAKFGGNFYGTSVKAVKDVAEKGRICVLDIELEVRLSIPRETTGRAKILKGVKQVSKRDDLNARFLFLSPPSVEVLEQRLRGRGTDDEESVNKRLEQAKVEMEFAKQGEIHEKIVVNDELDKAYKEVEEFIVDGGKYGN